MENLRYGDPDGHGQYGMISHDDQGKVICHDCGNSFNQLATHVRLAHDTQPAEYRETHGIGATTRMVSTETSAKLQAGWARNEEAHLEALNTYRDPERAKNVSLRRTQWSPETRARRSLEQQERRGRDLTPEEVAYLGDPLDIPHWAPKARELLINPEIKTSALARAAGITGSTVTQRLRRYPAG